MADNTKQDGLPANVLKLISSKRWRLLKAYIFFNKSKYSKQRLDPSRARHQSMRQILRHACKFRPPLSIVEYLHKAYPNAVFECDGELNYPLHIACAYGCDPEVIEYLVKQNRNAAVKLNFKDRNPYLLACKCYLKKRSDNCKAANMELFEIMQTLYSAAPASPMQRDCNGKSPLEYIIETEADVLLLKFTQWINVRYHKETQRSCRTIMQNNKHLNFEELSSKKNYVLPQNMPAISASSHHLKDELNIWDQNISTHSV